MKDSDFAADLQTLLRGRFPYVYIVTWEEDRVTDLIADLNAQAELIGTKRVIYSWTVTNGLVRDPGGPNAEVVCQADHQRQTGTSHVDLALRTLDYISAVEEPALFILKDFQIYFGDASIAGARSEGDPIVIRKIRDLSYTLRRKQSPQNVLFISPSLKLHQDIEKSVAVLDFPLPTQAQIGELLESMISANSASGKLRFALAPEEKERLGKAALGLTLQEAENAFAKAIVRDNCLSAGDVETILDEKSQAIRRNGILEYVRSDVSVDMIGGLDNLKHWLAKRRSSWLDSAKEYSLPPPKGILITGVPGCGKSLTAKAMSAMWHLPLLRLDMGRVFTGLLGSSEENFRRAIQTAGAIAPSILWIDEIEKGMGGMSSPLSGGTPQRIFATFLTWMQEKTEAVFVIATANNISALPPEMMRKGRFDEIFFVDLPSLSERIEVFRVHLKKRYRANKVWHEVQATDAICRLLAEQTEGFVGAEIEQAIISALFDAYAESRPLTVHDIEKAIRNTVPLSTTQREQITQLREWANERAVSASPPETKTAQERSSKIVDAFATARGGRAVDV
jgi:SpoVK/Ycf46/Vps4 family AAA+-type ATPase